MKNLLPNLRFYRIFTLFAAFLAILLTGSPVQGGPISGCQNCGILNESFDGGLSCPPSLVVTVRPPSTQRGIALLGGININFKVWRIVLDAVGFGDGTSLYSGVIMNDGNDLCRHFDRPWSVTGMYWSDYESTDPKINAVAARTRGSPIITIKVRNSDWGYERTGNDHVLYRNTSAGKTTYTRSTVVNYVLASTYVRDQDTKNYVYDVNGKVSQELAVRDTVTNKITYYCNTEENSALVRQRATEVTWDASGVKILRTTLYGYYPPTTSTNANDLAAVGQIRYVVRPEKVAKYLETYPEQSINADNPNQSCLLDTTDVSNLLAFASVQCTSYATYSVTDTLDMNDNYQTLGEQVNVVRLTGASTDEGGGCGCGAGGAGGGPAETFRYDYGENPSFSNQYASATNDMGRLNVWQTYVRSVRLDGTGTPSRLRTVQFVNAWGFPLFTVKQEMSGDTILNSWIEHDVLDAKGRTIEHRTPSACANYTVSASNGWITAVTADDNGSSGLVELSTYDTPKFDQLLTRAVRQGTKPSSAGGNPEYLLNSNTYLTHMVGAVTNYHLATETQFPTATTNQNASDRLITAHAYSFYTNCDIVQIETVAQSIVSTGNNGSGATNSVSRHYSENNGEIWNDWIQYEDGTLAYTEIHTDELLAGRTLKSIEDVDTSQTGDFTYPPPTGWATPTGAGTHRITRYTYYDTTGEFGGTKTVQTPDGLKSVNAQLAVNQSYNDNGTNRVATLALIDLRTRHMDGSGYYGYLPMNIGVSCVAGRPLIGAQGNSNSSADGDLTDDIAANYLNGTISLRDLENGFNGTLTARSDTYYDFNSRPIEERQYFAIPVSGEGVARSNYLSVTYAYDPVTGQRTTVKQPDNTVNLTVFDQLNRPIQTWQGVSSNAVSAVTTNDLFQIGQTVYDQGGIGDSLATLSRQYLSNTGTLDTALAYDWRDRQTRALSPDGILAVTALDWLSRPTTNLIYAGMTDVNATPPGSNLRAMNASWFDELGRTWKTSRYAVDPVSGTVGNRLTSKSWFDFRGRTIKTADPAGLFRKTRFDSLGRAVASYLSFQTNESTYAEAFDVAGDTVIEQTETQYDVTNGLAIVQRTLQRYESAPGAGELSLTNARQSVFANWYDTVNRLVYSANYGDNGGATFARAGTPPEPNTSDDYIVSKTVYDNAGRVSLAIDNLAITNRTYFDDIGRTTRRVENYTDGTVTETKKDTDRTTEYVFDGYGRLAHFILQNPKGAGNGVEDQTTKFVYGDPVNGSRVTAKIYPDSTDTLTADATGVWTIDDGSDHLAYVFNRIGQLTSQTDQRGVERDFVYDTGKRLLSDTVTILPDGVDGAVQRIGNTYTDMGLLSKVTSYGDAAGTAVTNEVAYTFDGWGNITNCSQAHAGAVLAGTPGVSYIFDDGAVAGEAQYVRLTSKVYPNIRVVTNLYNSGLDATLNRLSATADSSAPSVPLVAYTYLGAGTIIQFDHPQVAGNLALSYGSSGSYPGFDNFGRVIDQKWTIGTNIVDRFQYAHDRLGNRIARQTLNDGYSEGYQYDGLQQLTRMDRSNGVNQVWNLEPAGNWAIFTTNGIAQTRTHNIFNEITTLNGNTNIVQHDRAGNMIIMPTPYSPLTTNNSPLTCIYDAWNRLVSATSAVSAVKFSYDGDWKRIQKTAGDAQTEYYYDDMQLAETRTNGVASEQFVYDTRYLHSAAVRDILTPYSSLLARYFPVNDANFNVTALVSTNGDVLEQYTYDPYGNVTIRDANWNPITWDSSTQNIILFTGHKFDFETGLYYSLYRYYHPQLGRWLTRDPLMETRDNLALRAFSKNTLSKLNDNVLLNYCNNNPIGNCDKLGQLSEAIKNEPTFLITDKCTGKGGFEASGGGDLNFTEWTLGSGQRNGYIVQHVKSEGTYVNCNGSNRQEIPIDDVWEAWRVDGGIIERWTTPISMSPYKYDNLLYSDKNAEKCGTKGMVRISFEAGFYEGTTLGTTTGAPWTTGADPWFSLMGLRPPPQPIFIPVFNFETSKSVSYTWTCCMCNRKRTLGWDVGNKSKAIIESDSLPCP